MLHPWATAHIPLSDIEIRSIVHSKIGKGIGLGKRSELWGVGSRFMGIGLLLLQ